MPKDQRSEDDIIEHFEDDEEESDLESQDESDEEYVEKKNKHKKHKKNHKNKKSKKTNIILAIISVLIIAAVILGIYYLNKQIKLPVPQENEDIVAIVNGEKIPLSLVEKTYKVTVPETYRDFIRKGDFLNMSVIPQTLLIQEAKNSGIEVSDKNITDILNNFFTARQMTEEDFKAELAKSNITLEEFKEVYKRNYLVNLFIDEKIISMIEVSDAEIQNYYKSNKNLFNSPEQIRASHILVETKEEAEGIINQLQQEQMD